MTKVLRYRKLRIYGHLDRETYQLKYFFRWYSKKNHYQRGFIQYPFSGNLESTLAEMILIPWWNSCKILMGALLYFGCVQTTLKVFLILNDEFLKYSKFCNFLLNNNTLFFYFKLFPVLSGTPDPLGFFQDPSKDPLE